MKKITYMIKRIFEMDFKAMFKTAKRISKITKKPSVIILFDIIYYGYIVCLLRRVFVKC